MMWSLRGERERKSSPWSRHKPSSIPPPPTTTTESSHVTMLSGLMALGLLASLGSSTLSRPHQAAFSAPSSIDDLARRFAPVIYLA